MVGGRLLYFEFGRARTLYLNRAVTGRTVCVMVSFLELRYMKMLH